MSVHLQQVRLYATTKDQGDAGTDSGVEFWFYVTSHSLTTWFPEKKSTWQHTDLDHRWDDRERGRTEMYEIDLGGGLGINIGGTMIPQGIAFESLDDARSADFWLKMKGDDWWLIDHYVLLGYFKEIRGVLPGPITDCGWLLMAARDGDVDLSTDPSEGSTWHPIYLNRIFACEAVSPISPAVLTEMGISPTAK